MLCHISYLRLLRVLCCPHEGLTVQTHLIHSWNFYTKSLHFPHPRRETPVISDGDDLSQGCTQWIKLGLTPFRYWQPKKASSLQCRWTESRIHHLCVEFSSTLNLYVLELQRSVVPATSVCLLKNHFRPFLLAVSPANQNTTC